MHARAHARANAMHMIPADRPTHRLCAGRYCQPGSAAHGAAITCDTRAPGGNDEGSGAVRDGSLEFRLVASSAYQQQAAGAQQQK